MKKCADCQENKPLEEFHLRKDRYSGVRPYCKECMKLKNTNNKSSLRLLRLQALDKLGAFCLECGFDDVRALQIDHKDGGGSQARKSRGPSAIYREIANGATDGYQVLCANHNWIKRSEDKEHGNYFRDRSVL